MPRRFYPKYCRSVGCYKCPVPKAVCKENYCQRRVTGADWLQFKRRHCKVRMMSGEYIVCPDHAICYKQK